MMMDRFVASSFYTSSNLAIKERQSVSFPTRLSIINQESKSIRQAHPGNGLFLEIENNEIDEISHILSLYLCNLRPAQFFSGVIDACSVNKF